jgi:hypothetical protein
MAIVSRKALKGWQGCFGDKQPRKGMGIRFTGKTVLACSKASRDPDRCFGPLFRPRPVTKLIADLASLIVRVFLELNH